MKVLFVAPSPRAGTLQYTHNLANALADRGHEVMLATGLGFEMAPYPRRYRAIEVFDRFRPRPLRLAGFAQAVRRMKPDIVHFQGAQHPDLYLVLLTILRGLTRATFVYTPQDVLPNKERSHHARALSALYRRVSHVFLNAKQNEEKVTSLFGVPPEHITVLPLPDVAAFIRDGLVPVPPDIPDGRKLVLCFGLIEPRKGIGTLIEAFRSVLKRVPEAYLLVVGRALMDVGDFEDQLQSDDLRGSARMDNRYVSFEEMAGLFYRADMVVLPYHNGWNSGVLASAIGFGKPVVATTVGGFEEIVRDGETGFLVPPAEAAPLADAIVRLMTDAPLRERMAASLSLHEQEASWNSLAATTEKVYEQVAASREGKEAEARA